MMVGSRMRSPSCPRSSSSPSGITMWVKLYSFFRFYSGMDGTDDQKAELS